MFRSNFFLPALVFLSISANAQLMPFAFIINKNPKTTFLSHMDGTNGSTTFTDVAGHTISVNGTAQVSTAQSQFGGASAVFDGTGSYLRVPTGGNIYKFSDGNLTVEGWVYLNSFSNAQSPSVNPRIFSLGDVASNDSSDGISLATNGTNKFILFVQNSVGSYVVSSSTISSFSTGVWYHFAVTRSGNTWRLFINGNNEVTTTASATYAGMDLTLNISRTSNSAWHGFMNGYIDEFRVYKGNALYTSDFTPQITPFSFPGP